MRGRLLVLVLAAIVAMVPAVRAGENVLAYTDMEPEHLNAFRKTLAKEMPDLAVKWVRESGGPVTARLLAEKDNPQADIIFGLTLMSVLELDSHGVLAPYTPKGFDELDPAMRDDGDEPAWIGMSIYAAAICVNTPEMQKAGLPDPETWDDLTKPEYQGHIIMPNPVSSGTAYLLISGWIAAMGEEKAWDFMERLHKNVKMYVHSGSKPAQMAAMGETAIGLSVESYAMPYIRRRAPIRCLYPADGVGWDILAVALVKGGKNVAAAKRLMDFGCSAEATALGVAQDFLPVRPALDNERMAAIRPHLLPLNFRAAAGARKRIIEEWRRRFE